MTVGNIIFKMRQSTSHVSVCSLKKLKKKNSMVRRDHNRGCKGVADGQKTHLNIEKR